MSCRWCFHFTFLHRKLRFLFVFIMTYFSPTPTATAALSIASSSTCPETITKELLKAVQNEKNHDAKRKTWKTNFKSIARWEREEKAFLWSLAVCLRQRLSPQHWSENFQLFLQSIKAILAHYTFFSTSISWMSLARRARQTKSKEKKNVLNNIAQERLLNSWSWWFALVIFGLRFR